MIRLGALFLIMFMSGCGVLRPGIVGSGFVQTEARTVAAFDQIDVSGFATVNVVGGQHQSVVVTTDDNLLPYVETQVENGRLKIKSREKIKPKSKLFVDVTVPGLRAAKVSGAGDLFLSQIVADHLELTISGAGTLNASGHAQQVSAKISGAGDADLSQLYADDASIRISGAGDAKVFASNSIKANISGAGDIDCYGDPLHVDQRISGAGDFSLHTSDLPTQISLSDQTPHQ